MSNGGCALCKGTIHGAHYLLKGSAYHDTCFEFVVGRQLRMDIDAHGINRLTAPIPWVKKARETKGRNKASA